MIAAAVDSGGEEVELNEDDLRKEECCCLASSGGGQGRLGNSVKGRTRAEVMTALINLNLNNLLCAVHRRTVRTYAFPSSSSLIERQRPSLSGGPPCDLISEQTCTVVNSKRQILFWSHLNWVMSQTYDVWQFKT